MTKQLTTKIIGITGFIGSGKGTVGDMLKEHGYKPMSFASKVKDVVSVVFGWDRALLEGDTKESREYREIVDPYWSAIMGKEITPRYILQITGTELFRKHIHNDVWVHALFKDIENSGYDKVVITDARFPNELKQIKNYGGTCLRVKRGNEPEWYDTALRANTGEDVLYLEMMHKAHLSEWAWVGHRFDSVISNDGTLDDLRQKVNSILEI